MMAIGKIFRTDRGRLWRLIPCIIVLALMLPSCRPRPHYQADISGIALETVGISRFEKILFEINPTNLREEIAPYLEEFHFFLGDGIDDPMGQQQLIAYMSDPLLIELYHDTMEAFPSLDKLQEDFTRAFKYYLAHFPDQEPPRLYSYISGLSYELPIKHADGHMAIGLDNYLGRDYPYYAYLQIPRYQQNRMEADYLLVDAMMLLAEKHMSTGQTGAGQTGAGQTGAGQTGAGHPEPETLLDFMIYEGKLLYFVDCMLPELHDSLKIGYTGSQLAWMQANRGQVWSYYLDNELLFDSNRQMIRNFVGEAPFTSVFGRGSAPRTGVYTGWQIVRDYMRRHPEVTLAELMHQSDARQILHQSRYRGR